MVMPNFHLFLPPLFDDVKPYWMFQLIEPFGHLNH